jgi:Ni/Co efflux regulator RcnB
MKKLLVTVATVALSVAPAAAAHADTTNIDAMQNQSYSTNASKDSGKDTSIEQYSNKTVSYAALYSVKYDASETNYLKAMTSQWDTVDHSADAMNHYTTSFNTMMGGWGGQQGGGAMGGGWSHEN